MGQEGIIGPLSDNEKARLKDNIAQDRALINQAHMLAMGVAVLAGVIVVAAAAAVAISMGAGQKPIGLTLYAGVIAFVTLFFTVVSLCASFMASMCDLPADETAAAYRQSIHTNFSPDHSPLLGVAWQLQKRRSSVEKWLMAAIIGLVCMGIFAMLAFASMFLE